MENNTNTNNSSKKKKRKKNNNNTNTNRNTQKVNTSEKREIKQVFVEDDGKEKVVTSGFVKTEEEQTEEFVEKETLKEIEEEETASSLEKVNIESEDDIEIEQLEETELGPDNDGGHSHVEINENGEEEFLVVHEEKAIRKRRGRIIALVAVFLLSIFLAAFVGTSLALWDSDKTFTDLHYALFPQQVQAATVSEETEEILESDSVEDENANKEQTSENVKDEVSDGTSNETEEKEEPANSITSEISGVETFSKAGETDEITNVGENTKVVQYVDPTSNYPVSFTNVDESYFTDALFIGDSRLQGFGMWSGLPATFYTAVGFQLYNYETTKVVQTENGKVPIFDAMPFDAFTKVYIKVGLNEMGWANEEKFENLYAEVIAKIREREPRAIIYIHGLLPVTASKDAEGTAHNNVNITERNAALRDFAVSQKAYFVDAGQSVVGPDGCLPGEMTSDGIHLKSQYMGMWKQYLMNNAVVLR